MMVLNEGQKDQVKIKDVPPGECFRKIMGTYIYIKVDIHAYTMHRLNLRSNKCMGVALCNGVPTYINEDQVVTLVKTYLVKEWKWDT